MLSYFKLLVKSGSIVKMLRSSILSWFAVDRLTICILFITLKLLSLRFTDTVIRQNNPIAMDVFGNELSDFIFLSAIENRKDCNDVSSRFVLCIDFNFSISFNTSVSPCLLCTFRPMSNADFQFHFYFHHDTSKDV